jgi:alkanesulfonate monooxygenase SsuD/methylene tetrahydromethanopterin reductase-like flavin-dependent oxidoreductase (luciferase family)
VQRYRDTLDQAAHAETLGLIPYGQLSSTSTPASIMHAPLLMLAALAERTRNLRLGIAIILLPLPHPLRVA